MRVGVEIGVLKHCMGRIEVGGEMGCRYSLIASNIYNVKRYDPPPSWKNNAIYNYIHRCLT